MPEVKPLNRIRGLSEELIQDLEALFPEKSPGLSDSERIIFYNAGKSALVRELRLVWEYQKRQNKDEHNVNRSAIDRLAGI